MHIDYVWVDGQDFPLVRSKTKVVRPKVSEEGEYQIQVPEWTFDGSSTSQGTTEDSERVLDPKRLYRLSDSHYITLCEVLHPNSDRTPHISNHRADLASYIDKFGSDDLWLGFEQEFFLTKKDRNVMWPKEGEPRVDSRYYCSSGGPIKFRRLIRDFAGHCQVAGINIVGYNTEVSPGQWEYQVFAEDALKAADDLWVSRYLLQLSAETYDIGIGWHPKPHAGWNGSGCHTNFSNKKMREDGGEELFRTICSRAEMFHDKHMSVYGVFNDRRMTGLHETSSYTTFSCGVGSRNTSFRIPNSVVEDEWKGYLEDRRPASNCDPYRVAKCVLEILE